MTDGIRGWPHTRIPLAFAATLLVLLSIAVGVGAYLDWIWWHPTQGIVVTLVAIGLLLVAGVALVLRRPLATRLALATAVVAAGLLAGQLLGPQRPTLEGSEGTMTIRLDAPIGADGSGSAYCQAEPDGGQIQVSDDSNIRLSLPGVQPEARPFVSAVVYRGDRWSPATAPRDDGLALVVTVSSAVESAAGSPTELRLEAGPDSTLIAEVSEAGGTLSFSGLTIVSGDVESLIGAAGQVSGTVTWSCGT